MLKKLLLAVLVLAAQNAGAVTRLTTQSASKSGVTPTRWTMASSETYKFRNDGRVVLLFEKTGAGACTVTLVTPGTAGGLAIADQTVSVIASTGDTAVGPLPTSLFNDSSGDVSFTLSDTVGLSVAILKL